MRGTVKFFNHKSKFGFIRDDESGIEYYVHQSQVDGQIEENDTVTFELKEEKRGPTCVEVKKVD